MSRSLKIVRKSNGLGSDLFAPEIQLREFELSLLLAEVKDVKIEARSIALVNF